MIILPTVSASHEEVRAARTIRKGRLRKKPRELLGEKSLYLNESLHTPTSLASFLVTTLLRQNVLPGSLLSNTTQRDEGVIGFVISQYLANKLRMLGCLVCQGFALWTYVPSGNNRAFRMGFPRARRTSTIQLGAQVG